MRAGLVLNGGAMGGADVERFAPSAAAIGSGGGGGPLPMDDGLGGGGGIGKPPLPVVLDGDGAGILLRGGGGAGGRLAVGGGGGPPARAPGPTGAANPSNVFWRVAEEGGAAGARGAGAALGRDFFAASPSKTSRSEPALSLIAFAL